MTINAVFLKVMASPTASSNMMAIIGDKEGTIQSADLSEDVLPKLLELSHTEFDVLVFKLFSYMFSLFLQTHVIQI